MLTKTAWMNAKQLADEPRLVLARLPASWAVRLRLEQLGK